MQVLGNAQLSALDPIQRLLGLLPSQAGAAGQTSPIGADDTAETPSPTPPKADQGPGAQFAARTLASLLQVQTQPPTPSDLASALIGQADANGDGGLNIAEIQSVLGKVGDTSTGADAVSQAMAKLDTNGDGKLSAGEIAAGFDSLIQTQAQAQAGTQTPAADPTQAAAPAARHGRHHGHHGVSGADLAQQLIGSADASGDGALSPDEITAQLQGSGASLAASTLTTAIGKLDTDGDGKLSGAELAAAIDTMRQAYQQGTASAGAFASASATSGATSVLA